MKRIFAILAIFIIIGGILFYLLFIKRSNTGVVKIRLPDGEVVELKKVPPVDKNLKKKLDWVEINGKIDIVKSNPSENSPTKLVMVSNDGELIFLFNPPITNYLRFGYIGKLMKIGGYWYHDVLFFGKNYRSMWVEYFDVLNELEIERKKISNLSKEIKNNRKK